MTSRLQSLVDRLLLTQVPPEVPGSWNRSLVILDLGLLKVHSLDVVGGAGGRGVS